ncbi:hypothetical protein [Parasitella parasitica]|uniref:Uncharacterized protein n=1 Tax=Parasitella parasitica TaxID=35722 RepID=A0A0B7N3Z6_9FUNG|nr:hypothetical protein [Parasitella parasitica]
MEQEMTNTELGKSEKEYDYSNVSEQPNTTETSVLESPNAEETMAPSITMTTVEATTTTQDTMTTQVPPAYATTAQTATADLMSPYSQPPVDLQSIVSNPIPTVTENSIVPTTVIVYSSNASLVSTETCLFTSWAATTSTNACLPTSKEAASAGITVAQIAGITIGILGVCSLLIAFMLVKNCKHRKREDSSNNKRRMSPFFCMNDHVDQEKCLGSEKSGHCSQPMLCQSIENEHPATRHVSDLSESVHSDNTSYRRSSSIVNHHEINQVLTVITSPAELHQHHTISPFGKPNMNPTMMVEAPSSPYPQNKHTGSNVLSRQLLSTDADTDSYTLSAIRLFHSCSNRNTSSTTISMSPISSLTSSDVKQQYRPSLHDLIFSASQDNGSRDDFSTFRSSSRAQDARFSRHCRQESSLDPHFPSHKMSLWDDHLN